MSKKEPSLLDVIRGVDADPGDPSGDDELGISLNELSQAFRLVSEDTDPRDAADELADVEFDGISDDGSGESDESIDPTNEVTADVDSDTLPDADASASADADLSDRPSGVRLMTGDPSGDASNEASDILDDPSKVAAQSDSDEPGLAEEDDHACPVGPRTILEAMLFIGDTENRPLSTSRVASLIRGMSSDEVLDLIGQLNHRYAADGCPYRAVQDGEGYRLALHEEFHDVRNRFYGKVREARLSSNAIETLALVAYRQPITVEEVNRIRGGPSGNLLSQLVRRSLLQIDRDPDNRRTVMYRTTDRFLELFNLEMIGDLPSMEDLE